MKALIIDNQAEIRSSLRIILEQGCSDIKEIQEASGISSGIKMISELNPDILFLDVELDEGTGFDLLRKLNHYNFQLIFITAHGKYAVDAFRFSAIDFLVKPFDPDLVFLSVAKAKNHIKMEGMEQQIKFLLDNNKDEIKKDKIILRSAEAIHFVNISDIICLEADANYTKFIIDDSKPILVTGNLKEYESMLDNNAFIRTHHSFIIQINQVKSFDKKNDELIMINGMRVAVSTRKKEFVLEKLGL